MSQDRGPWTYRKIVPSELKRLRVLQYYGKNSKPRMLLKLDDGASFCPKCPSCGSEDIEIQLLWIRDLPAGRIAGTLYCEHCGADKTVWPFGNCLA